MSKEINIEELKMIYKQNLENNSINAFILKCKIEAFIKNDKKRYLTF